MSPPPTWSSVCTVAAASVLIFFLVDKAVLLLATAAFALYLMYKIPDSSGSPSYSSSSDDDDVGDGDGADFKPIPAGEYEVFLSFRGPDVRRDFADFLNAYLELANIRTFLDDKDIVKGEEIEGSLYKAIEDSKVYIPILSPGYASSKWCLRELSHMVKYCKQGKGNLIFPIFYMMNPRDVRHHSGDYTEAFVQHSERYDAETVKAWKEALTTVGKLKGWTVTKFDRQGVVAKEVFARVKSHLMSSYVLVTEQLVDINHDVGEVIDRMNKDVKVVGIVGMGGLGKTTIAKAVRDKVHMEFDYCFFLSDVRQTLTESGGILTLQRQIMTAIPGYDGNVHNPSQGVGLIRDRVHKKKCLFIIDDVDEGFEFEQILGKLEDFSSGSRFIITTRNRGVLEETEVYEPKGLDSDHSLQLFSRHAFRLDGPPEDRVALSKEFVKVAAGLPLALKVIGSTLRGKNEGFWKEKLMQLKDQMPDDMLRETLMISYSDLKIKEQKIFLDIASVFIGVSKELPFYMWRDCGFYPEIGIDALIFKSLIKVTEDNVFWMHDCTRDLGRSIIYEEDPQCPWKRSRIWSNKEAVKMIRNGEGTDQLEVLKVNMINNDLVLSDRQFERLSRLRYLEVSYGELKGNFERVLPNLCWLALDNCSLMHNDTNMKKSIVFIQRISDNSNVVHDSNGWENLKEAHNLKAIDLWNCNGLGKVPSLSHEVPESLVFNISLEDLKDRLELDSGGVKAIAIWGMGGIGKTTIARALYNEICREFDGCCFLENVQETLEETDGMVRLQRKIIHSILQSDCCKVEDVYDGINIIKTRMSKMKLLIVLDELNYGLQEILGDLEDFHSGSRFIISTRFMRVVQRSDMSLSQGCMVYQLKLMNVDDSLRLFSRHAFGADSPPEEDVDLSMEFVSVLRGHPLSVRVIGSLLFCRDKRFWEDTLARICSMPDSDDSDVLDILMVCYHELSHKQQQIFLDIACFFHGADKAQPSLMWDSCGLHPESAVAALIQRSLIEVKQSDDRQEFWMHSLLRDMGMAIVHKEDRNSPWSRSRIWSNNDAVHMLTHEMGTDRVKRIRVEIKEKNMRLTDRHFEKLSELEYLEVDGGEFEGDFERTLPEIRWLKLRNCGSNPIDCDMKKLVIFHMQGSSVRDDWRGWQNLRAARNLKSIRLHQCNHLEMVPDLSRCANLESIFLHQCTHLEMVPDLSGCENIESVDIQQCTKMKGELQISHLKHLKVLKIVDTNITKITGNIVMLSNLQEITLPRKLVYFT